MKPNEKFKYKDSYECGEFKVHQLGSGPDPFEAKKIIVPRHFRTRKKAKEAFFGRVKKCECGEIGIPTFMPEEIGGALDYTVEVVLCDKCREKQKSIYLQ